MNNSLSHELREEIIGLFQSDCMKEFALARQEELTVYNYIEIVTGAPESMAHKVWYLERILSENITPDEKETVTDYIQVAKEAEKMLKDFDREKSCLQVITIIPNYYTGFEPHIFEAVPVVDYKNAKRHINRRIWSWDDEGEKYLIDGYDAYYKVVLYDIDDTGKTKERMEYIYDSFGELQYLNDRRPCSLKNVDQHFAKYFSGRGLEYWETPFKSGDILYIDCHPYLPPTYCLVYYTTPEIPYDCCSLRCYYPTFLGLIAEGALKHGHFLPWDQLYYDQCCMSPLFRAEIYEGDLPEEYKFLEDVSKQLKENPALGEKLDMLTCGSGDYIVARRAYVPIGTKKEQRNKIYGITKKKLAEMVEKVQGMSIKK